MFVCIKQVYDPEAPPENFKIDPTTDKVVSAPGVLQVVDPYAEYAVEAALRIKDSNGGKVTAICLGTNLIGDVVKKPLCMGADELILLEDPRLMVAIVGQPPMPCHGYQEGEAITVSSSAEERPPIGMRDR